MTYPPLNSTGDWYDANWEGDQARAQQARDVAVKKRDAALDIAITEAFTAAGAIYGHPTAERFREVLEKQGLYVYFGSCP